MTNSMVFCRGCGKEIHETAISCPQCGAIQGKLNIISKSRVTAAVLALLLGGLGIHKFYTGAWGWGILYILFFWTCLPLFFSFIEGVRYFFMSDVEFKRQTDNQNNPFLVVW
jgi:TM2 domain-containing membrane protein YozV